MWNSESQGNPNPFELMIDYFDKRFEGIEIKPQESSNKKLTIENKFNFQQKENKWEFEFNEQVFYSLSRSVISIEQWGFQQSQRSL